MDEPFGALDPITRSELQRQFRALQQQLRTTVILVTHDVREALMLGTRIALLERGRVVTISPREEFATSTDPQVREYLSSVGEVPALASLFKQG
jgi:osmoprotectant transport system ATP-binding protein